MAVLVALENLLPPIPSEMILPLAGFLVSQGCFSFVPVLAASTAGSVAGVFVLYGIGRRLGEERVRWLVRRYGREVMFFGRLISGDWTDLLFGYVIAAALMIVEMILGVRAEQRSLEDIATPLTVIQRETGASA